MNAPIYDYTAFLCGCFTVKKNRVPLSGTGYGWIRESRTEDELRRLKKYFYPEFIDFCYKDECSDRPGIERFVLPVDTAIPGQDGEPCLVVKALHIYLLPYDLLIYSVQVAGQGKTLGQIIPCCAGLRNVADMDLDKEGCDYRRVMEPLADLYMAWSSAYDAGNGNFTYSDLVEFGNKLKIFQVAESRTDDMSAGEIDRSLFALGTMSHCTADECWASDEYYAKIMRENKVSVYGNWKGLSLFDTFTILSCPVEEWLRKNWSDNFFGMYYLHSLYVKFYLFRMNALFSARGARAAVLKNEFGDFERDSCFHKISYNFLPLEIYSAMDRGLEINEESERLYRKIEQEKNMQEERNNRRINGLLLLLTCLTIFSTAWDLNCLINQLYPYEDYVGSNLFGYRLVTGILLTFVLLIILGSRFARKIK